MAERSIRTFQFLNMAVSAPGTAERITAYYVPESFTVILTNPVGSAGNFYIAETQAKAQSAAQPRKILVPGQSIAMKVSNTAAIWVDADSASDELEVYVGDEVSGNTPSP